LNLFANFLLILILAIKDKEKVHLEIQSSRKSVVGVIGSTYWDSGEKKIKHSNYGRIKGKTLAQLKNIQAAMREETFSAEPFEIIHSLEFGATAAIRLLIEDLGLGKAMYSRKEQWVEDVIAMIVGKLTYQSSKLGLCNLHEASSVWKQAGVINRPDVEKHCYKPMDRLLERQRSIQKRLFEQSKETSVILYDITSTYFEGEYEESELVHFGYNRDGKRGKKQVVVGLVCNQEGCPSALEVFPGNTKDETTVSQKIEELQKVYGINKVLFVGDKGMLTSTLLDDYDKSDSIDTITSLSHHQIHELLSKEVPELELFDQQNIHEVRDPDNPQIRYCVCYNPVREQDNQCTRERLIELTEARLNEIANYKGKTTVEVLGSRVGKALQKYKMGRFVKWEVVAGESKSSIDHQLNWSWDQDKLAATAKIDGYFVIRSTHADMSKEAVVKTYKSLSHVEQAFRNLKHASIEVRPIWHRKDERIRSHVFLCMLAYHVQWHMMQRLKPLLDNDGKHAERQWSLESIIETLKALTVNTVKQADPEYQILASPTESQSKILNLLGIKNIATALKW
jgi:transposase